MNHIIYSLYIRKEILRRLEALGERINLSVDELIERAIKEYIG